jgi:hypothetical protein
MNEPAKTFAWPVESNEYFRYFRLVQFGAATNNRPEFMWNGFEIYGKLP